jgi:hypothetical protein
MWKLRENKTKNKVMIVKGDYWGTKRRREWAEGQGGMRKSSRGRECNQTTL